MVDLEDIYSQRVAGAVREYSAHRTAGRPHAIASVLLEAMRLAHYRHPQDGGRYVTDYAQDVRACLLGQTSASVMGPISWALPPPSCARSASRCIACSAKGRQLRRRWADLAILESVRYYKARHASTLLYSSCRGGHRRRRAGQRGGISHPCTFSPGCRRGFSPPSV